jgi:hypothetical protein
MKMRYFITPILVLTLLWPPVLNASKMREMVVTSSYGVLAGTLVGVSSLAFTRRPGDHLKNIAVGASLGLYAGLLLGLYIAYAVPEPGKDEEMQEEGVDGGPTPEGEDGAPPEGEEGMPPEGEEPYYDEEEGGSLINSILVVKGKSFRLGIPELRVLRDKHNTVHGVSGTLLKMYF